MTALWDTSVVSRLQPDGLVQEYVMGRSSVGDPVRVAAVSLLEVTYGYQRRIRDPRFRALLAWFTRLATADAFHAVPFDGRAALVAGRIRAETPHPPATRRHDPRSKTMRQAAWLLDIQIGATAYAAGLDVATENRRDFETVAGALGRLFPCAEALAVVEPPV